MLHPELKSGDGVTLAGVVTDVTADYVRVMLGDKQLSHIVHVSRAQIVEARPAAAGHNDAQGAVMDALIGRHGRLLPES